MMDVPEGMNSAAQAHHPESSLQVQTEKNSACFDISFIYDGSVTVMLNGHALSEAEWSRSEILLQIVAVECRIRVQAEVVVPFVFTTVMLWAWKRPCQSSEPQELCDNLNVCSL